MSTRQRIDGIINTYPSGDVEDYFSHMNNLMQLNSGNNSYHMATHVSFASPAPLKNGTAQTKFMITDSGMDIVDISKGLIALRVKMDLEFRIGNNESNLIGAKLYESYYRNCCYFFIGFKSGSHIIKHYSIVSKGGNNDCDQSLSLPEQTIVYNCKSASERAARPGLYSPHEEVMKMSDCVCGAYIQQPVIVGQTTKIPGVEFEVLIQLDDLLPLSGMTLYPQFICDYLELHLNCELQKNMVFCPIPVETVFQKRMFTEPVELGKEFGAQFADGTGDSKVPSQISTHQLNTTQMMYTQNLYSDFKFTQCGDYSRACIGVTTEEDLQKSAVTDDSDFAGNAVYYTIVPTNFSIEEAQSYVYGFGLKESAKVHLQQIFAEQGVIKVPAQWIDHVCFPQTVDGTGINANTNKSLFECDQIIITFPNSDNQMTVSRNPHLETFHVKVGSKINLPELQMTTCDRVFSEMTLSALSLDSLFSAPNSLIKALTPNKEKRNDKFYGVDHEDDSDFMLVCDLERNGSGIFSDGVSGINVPIRLEATYLQGRNNPHFYEYNGDAGVYELRRQAPNIFTVSDACWLLTTNGPIFIKDANKRELTLQTEQQAREAMLATVKALTQRQQLARSKNFANIN